MIISNLVQGAIGQIKGPLTNKESITFSTGNEAGAGRPPDLKLGISIDEKDLMTYGWRFEVTINKNIRILIGSTGRYEFDEKIAVDTISFPEGAPASVIIDYVVLDI